MPPTWLGTMILANLRARYRRSRERQGAAVAEAGVEAQNSSRPLEGSEMESACAGDGARFGLTAEEYLEAWELKGDDMALSADVIYTPAHQARALPEQSFDTAATAGTLAQGTTSLPGGQPANQPLTPKPTRRPRIPVLCGLRLPALSPERSFETVATAGTYRPRGRRIRRASAESITGSTALPEPAATQEREEMDAWKGERTPVERVFGTPVSPPPVRRKVPGVGIRMGGGGAEG